MKEEQSVDAEIPATPWRAMRGPEWEPGSCCALTKRQTACAPVPWPGFALLVVWLLRAMAAEPVVSNVRVEHRSRPAEFEVVYDLEDADGDELAIGISASDNSGKTYRVLTNGLSGDVGPGIKPGRDRRIVWRGPVEQFVGERVQLRFLVAARDIHPMEGMVAIGPGRFSMGSPESEVAREHDEGPLTEVVLSRRFWLARHEVTQREWESLMGNNPSRFRQSPDLPVEEVSWEEASAYCRRLTQREREAGRLPTGYEYRLPTEAEWEYACRAGTTTATAFGDHLDSTQANLDGSSPYNVTSNGPNRGRPATVGSYPANAWGFHDMHGNVWEWCFDWYSDRLPGGDVTDPHGPQKGIYRAVRGGGWSSAAKYCRSSYRRSGLSPSHSDSHIGFRVACALVLQ